MSQVKVLFFNINGSGLGHMNRCLSYARRLVGRVQPVFFSLASAIEIIEEMGFEAEYFVSHYWSASSTFAWNSELAIRFGMVLERVQPAGVVFDGTWPFQGFMAACKRYGNIPLVWSNRGLLKDDVGQVQVDESQFDLVIQPGELDSVSSQMTLPGGRRKIVVPPVCLLEDDELLDKVVARKALGLSPDEKYVLFSLGPGNLKDISGIGRKLLRAFENSGMKPVWARSPISVKDVILPYGIESIVKYPLVRYMRAFDAFVGAAGYNTCCEVVQTQIPSLLVPNIHLVDDQLRRANQVSTMAPAVVSGCETDRERHQAMDILFEFVKTGIKFNSSPVLLNGASVAANEIVALACTKETTC